MAQKSTKPTQPEFDFRTIKTYEDACNHLGIATEAPEAPALLAEFQPAILACYRLMIIFKAINNGWIPDWSDWSQYKYSPWLSVRPSGFGFSGAFYYYDISSAAVGSRLCTDTSQKAMYIAQQFEKEYEAFFLYPQE